MEVKEKLIICDFIPPSFRVVFGLFFVMNLVLWSKGSSGAVPFSTLVALLALWFCVSVPLTFVGAYLGFRKRVNIKFSVSISIQYISYQNYSFSLFAAVGASRSYKSNSTSNSRPIDLHAAHSGHHYGRCAAIWMHFHSVVLHIEFVVVQPNVLHVWIFVLGLLDSRHHMLRDNHTAVLFPFVCRRLPLVVAFIFNQRLHGILSIHLLLPLLCHKTIDRR